jgi:hypothetical protein
LLDKTELWTPEQLVSHFKALDSHFSTQVFLDPEPLAQRALPFLGLKETRAYSQSSYTALSKPVMIIPPKKSTEGWQGGPEGTRTAAGTPLRREGPGRQLQHGEQPWGPSGWRTPGVASRMEIVGERHGQGEGWPPRNPVWPGTLTTTWPKMGQDLKVLLLAAEIRP